MTRRLRIGIDGKAFSSPAAGVRRYVENLTAALLSLGEPLDIVVLGGDRTAAPAATTYVAAPAHPPTNLGWSLVGLPRAAARGDVDLIHAPAYTAPLWGSTPVVLTIHDVSYERHPEWYPYRRDVVRRAFYRRSARSAAHIVTDSQFSASEIVAAYAIDPRRITVAPLGVSASFAVRDPQVAEETPAGIETPYLLHVGDLHPRRNLPMLVGALLDARRGAGTTRTLSLVLAGIDRGIGDELRAIALKAGAPEAVVLLGPVSETLLGHLYRRAAALAYPSLYEGFGLPLLEAMASGTPVIASRAASIPEVVGDAGVILDASDTSAWTTAIVDVVTNRTLSVEMRTKGLARAATFTWERTARMTLDVYRRVAGVPA